jgi:Glycosyl transferase family 2/Dolichyl-phosphate-mannose-protein mannosyltransferase
MSSPLTIPQQPTVRPGGSQIGGRHASLAVMIWWGLAFRIGYIIIGHSYKFRIGNENFGFGWETGRIARALALGHGFSNPMNGITGPTAWLAPVYPTVVAAAFKIFGIYSNDAAFVLLCLNSVFSALTAIPIYFVARKCFDERVARWSAWTWTLLPYTMYWAVRWVWETSMSTFLMATLLWLTVELAERGTMKLWAWWGFLWGALSLTNPACTIILPFFAGWVVWQRVRLRQRWFIGSVVAGAICLALLTPWTVRNYRVFHKFIFIRGNAGAELRLGNGPNADGTWMWYLHPSHDPNQLKLYTQMGEVAYVEMRKNEALTWMKQNPARFAVVTLERTYYYWAGVPRLAKVAWLAPVKNALFLISSVLAWWGLGRAIRKRMHAVFLFASMMVVYPLTYYIVFPHARYRHPIEPAMMILGMYLISETRELKQKGWQAANRGQFSSGDPQRITTLSIIIPCYNERNTIRNVVDTVRRAHLTHDGNDGAAGLKKEIVIVDDFSRDGTREVLSELEEEAHYNSDGVPVRIFYHDHNQGKGAAVRTGIKSAGGDLIVIQDADLEYDPTDFPSLLAPILAGRADAVFGNRFHGGAHRVLYFWHMVANRTLTLFCNMLTDLNLADMEVGYKVFRREIFDHIKLKSDRFGFEPEVTIKSAKLGCRIYEVPVAYHGRTYAEGKKIGWKDGVAAMWHMIKYRFFD